MNITYHIAEKKQQEAANTQSMKWERKRLERQIEDLEVSIVPNAHAPETVAELREKMAATEAHIKLLDRELSKPWKAPTPRQADELSSLQNRVNQLATNLAFADSALANAIRNERPKAEAEARKEVAEIEAELPKVQAKLRKACEAAELGADRINSICGKERRG